MKNSLELRNLIREATKEALQESFGGDIGPGAVPDELLDDATQLLMMISGRFMAAKDHPVPTAVIQQAIDHIELVDGLLAKAGLQADMPLDETQVGSQVHGDVWKGMMQIQTLQKQLSDTIRMRSGEVDPVALAQIAQLLQSAISTLKS